VRSKTVGMEFPQLSGRRRAYGKFLLLVINELEDALRALTVRRTSPLSEAITDLAHRQPHSCLPAAHPLICLNTKSLGLGLDDL